MKRDNPSQRPLTEERLAAAAAQFEALATGSTSAPEVQAFIAQASDLPTLIAAARRFDGEWATGSFEHWARTTPPADMAFNHASIALNGACDALAGLYICVVQARALMTYANLTLIRHACEAGLLARWLLGDLTPNGVVARGYAAEWKSVKEEQRFVSNMTSAGAVEPAMLRSLEESIQQRNTALLDAGRSHRLLKKDKHGFHPKLRCPSQSELFRDVCGPSPHTNMEWLYNVLSGVAHGMAWASLTSSRPKIVKEYVDFNPAGVLTRSGVVLSLSDPNAAFQLLPLQVAILQVSDATSRFAEARGLPAPRA